MEKHGWIDGLKGVALCGVLMIHCGGGNLPSVLGVIGRSGRFGVQIFFLLSAFLTFMSLERAIGQEYKIKEILQWIIKKITRLMPLYYLSIVVYVFFTSGSEYWLGSQEYITGWNILTHFLFIHGFFPHYCDSILGVEWYIGVLVIFIVISPILYKVIDSFEKALLTFSIGSIVCWGVCYIANVLVPQVDDAYIYTSYINSFWIVAQFPILLLGILLFFTIKKSSNFIVNCNKMLTSFSLFILSVALIARTSVSDNGYVISTATVFGICFFLLAYSQYLFPMRIIDNGLFRYLGKYSYAIYLVHYFLIFKFEQIIKNEIVNYSINWLIKFIVVLSVSAILAYFLSEYVEKPIIKQLFKEKR